MSKRLWIAALGVLGVALWLQLFSSEADLPSFKHFRVYWVAGAKAAEHRTVYDVQGLYQFKYSPFVALLWALPTRAGSFELWSWLHYVTTCIGWYLLIFWFAHRIDPKRAWLLFAAASAVFSLAIRDELKLGQVNLWPFLLVLPAWVVGRRVRAQSGFDWSGFLIGSAWGLAVQWKLYALVLAPLWFLRRRSMVFAGAVAITILTLGVAMALAHGPAFAIDENRRWIESLTASTRELLGMRYNVSLLGFLHKAARATGVPFGAWAYGVWLTVAALGFFVLAWGEREASRENDRLSWFWPASFAWALVAVLNPLVWPYWQLLAIPLFLIYTARSTADDWRGAGPVFYAVAGSFTVMNWMQRTWVAHFGGGLIALLVLLVGAYGRARSDRYR